MSGMTSYFLRRMILVPITFLVITFMVYTITRIVPGGPIEQAQAQAKMQAMTGEAGGGESSDDAMELKLDEEGMEQLKAYYNFDQTIPVGYLQWLGVWPRRIETRVPAVPVGEHEATLKELTTLAKTSDEAQAELAAHTTQHGWTWWKGALYAPAPKPEGALEDAAPEVALREGLRAEAARLRVRTFGDRSPLQQLIGAEGYAYQDGVGYLLALNEAAFDDKASLEEAHRLGDESKAAERAYEDAVSRTGYELDGKGGLVQTAFRPLKSLYDRRAEAKARLSDHLGEKGLIEFRGRFYAKIEHPEEELGEDDYDDAEELRGGGFGKRDDLLTLLFPDGRTFQGGSYYAEVDADQEQKDPTFFETARQLYGAWHLAGSELERLEEERGFKIRKGGRTYQVEEKLSGVLEGDFGWSSTRGEAVLPAIFARFEVSVPFGVTGFLLTWLVCIPLGVFKAIKHRSLFDTASSFVVFLGYSMPGFVVCIVLLATVAAQFGWLPLGGHKPDNYAELGGFVALYERVRYMVIPVIGYMIGGFATMTILTKNSLMDNLSQDYVRTAVAKGLSERRVIFLHALRNSLIPVTARLGHALGILFAGSFLIEKACNIDGMGLMGFHAIQQRDYPIVLGVLVFGVAIKLIGNILSDLIWAAIDPRIRFQ